GATIKYINPSANLSYIKKVAILPFNNFSEDKYAGEKTRSALTIDLMARHVFDVMEQGEVSKVMGMIFREEGFEEGRAVQMDKDMVKMLGEKLGVQAVILGSVNEYSSSRGGGGSSNNVVSISMRMIDTSSGIILWQANTTEVGNSMLRKMLGVDQVEMSILTRDAVRRAISTLL
ncbi:MAG: GNA1162 family protein, partial [Deltaproteobacteria bacterium]